MSTAELFSLISILILTGAMSLTCLYTFERALAVESNCDPKIQSLFGCPLVSAKERSFALVSAKIAEGEKENIDIGIDVTDSASGSSQSTAGANDVQNNGANDDIINANIELKIPSIINAIPFP